MVKTNKSNGGAHKANKTVVKSNMQSAKKRSNSRSRSQTRDVEEASGSKIRKVVKKQSVQRSLAIEEDDNNNAQVAQDFDRFEKQEDAIFNDHVQVRLDSERDQEFPDNEEIRSVSADDENCTSPIASEEIGESEISFNKGGRSDKGQPSADLTSLEEETDFEELARQNPAFKRYVQKLVNKETKSSSKQCTPIKQKTQSGNLNPVKSPSDMTIYALALNKRDPNKPKNDLISVNELNNISKFIEGIRMEGASGSSRMTPPRIKDRLGPRVSDQGQEWEEDQEGSQEITRPNDPREEAKEKASRLVLQAEKFKATVNMPTQGIVNNQFFDQEVVRDDDEFFHITCHVDSAMFSKIERGAFVELDKLLPKSKVTPVNENKTELIFKEGRPIIVPHIDRLRVINGIRKWEQAFRV